MNKKILIALLLHDIGRLIGRDKIIRSRFESSANSFYKEGKYFHAQIGAWWLDQIFHDIKEWQWIENVILYHLNDTPPHNIDENTHSLIRLADWLGSGERVEIEEKTTSFSHEDRLINVFYGLFGGQKAKQSFYPLYPLDLEHIYPREKEGDYAGLIEGFENELKELQLNKQNFLEKLYFLLFKYTWAVPAQTERAGFYPDISLFAHLKLTAALGICLLSAKINCHKILTKLNEYWQNNKRSFLESIEKEKDFDIPIATLLLGDLSGIQSFIFNVPSKGAAKSLKGRSLYLEILLYVIAHYILKEFNLPITNILYIGGGNFYLLLPPNKKDKLEELQRKIDKVLFSAHKRQIWVGLTWEDLNIKDLLNPNRFAKKFGRDIHDKMQFHKMKKFKSEDIFNPFSASARRCEVCGEEAKIEEEEIKICEFCDSLRRLARELRKAKYFYLKETDIRKNYKTYKDVFSAFGYEAGFCEKLKDDTRCYLINEIPEKLNNNLVGFIFLPISLPLSEEGNVLSFEELVEKGKGAKQLGVLKIDLDNLGFILGKGWEKWEKEDFNKPCEDKQRESKLSISRIAFLSTMLSLFFNWQVAKLAERDEYKDSIYLIFSGGDDVFAVGAWERVFYFLKEIREKFEEFTKNELVTFSSSYLIVPTHFPVIRFSHLIEDGLAEAKGIEEDRKCPPPKNKGMFLNVCLDWGYKGKREDKTSVWELYEWIERIEKEAERDIEQFSRRLGLIAGVFSSGLREMKKGKLKGIEHVWRFAYGLRDWVKQYQNLVEDLVRLNQELIVEVWKEGEKKWLTAHPDFINLIARILNLKCRG